MIYSDSSRAPSVIESRGYVFAFDYLGEITCNLISQHQRLGKNHAIALAECKAAYRAQLEAQPDLAQFLQENTKLYKAGQCF